MDEKQEREKIEKMVEEVIKIRNNAMNNIVKIDFANHIGGALNDLKKIHAPSENIQKLFFDKPDIVALSKIITTICEGHNSIHVLQALILCITTILTNIKNLDEFNSVNQNIKEIKFITKSIEIINHLELDPLQFVYVASRHILRILSNLEQNFVIDKEKDSKKPLSDADLFLGHK